MIEVSELSFLIELLLNHKLAPATKKLLQDRITFVESKYTGPTIIVNPGSQLGSVGYAAAPKKRTGPVQSASTQRILDEMAAEGVPLVGPISVDLKPEGVEVPVEPAPVIVAQVAQTAATAQALLDRQNAIRRATSASPLTGKPEQGRTSPRKF